ncbi:hypothetical protein [Archangium primigenium]|uniref:hypothetical protein n=1 Tax=Melittangium TaxID=44 RepID=UPI00195CE1C5|nr:hypothetical protein [Archangium primigenium]MBM7115372.1 hypothetical protein [Archangium primigenium]
MSGPGLNVPLSDPRMPSLRRVRPAAFLLLCLGIVDILFVIGMLVAVGLDLPIFPPPPGGEATAAQGLANLSSYSFAAVGAVLSRGLTIWGAVNALYLRRKGFVILGCLTAMVPFTPMCCMGLPVGVWLLTVLNDAQVRKHFT